MDKSVLLEAVYYSAPVPRSLEAITLMGLVFDRVYFPGVHLPDQGFSEDEVLARIEGLREVLQRDQRAGRRASTVALMICALQCLRWKRWTKDFLVYTNESGNIFEAPPGVVTMVHQIYEMTFGPPRPGFTPMFDTGSVFAVGKGEASIVYPGDFFYPANALLFASERGLPIVNDVPELAVPGMPNATGGDAKTLAAILAVECVQFLLPSLPQIDIYGLLDFRDEMRPHVEPFRLALLGLAMDLNLMLKEAASTDAIQEKARFVVESKINPTLIALKNFAESPHRSWFRRISAIARPASRLAASYFAVPHGAALAETLMGAGGLFAADITTQREKAAAIKRSPMYYLLRIKTLKG